MDRSPKRNKQQMFSLIEKFQQRKSTKKQFCLEEGISQSVFYYWEKKYKQACHSTDKGFMPVEIKGKAQYKYATTHSSVEITFPNGVILRLEGEKDIEMIRSLVTSI
mgnify:CR=1 FL=1